MNHFKIVAIVAALTLFVPAPQVEAASKRNKALIGAAIVGAVLASAASSGRSDNRYRSYDNGGDDRYYSYDQPQYYQQQQQYYPAASQRTYSDGYSSSRRVRYGYCSNVGYDRFGAYTYNHDHGY